MPKSHQFWVEYVDWPTNRPARRAKITITEPDGTTHELQLKAGELRSLARTVLTGLGYTKVVRSWHGKTAGWENRINRMVQPVMLLVEATFPKVRDDQDQAG